MQHFIKPYLHGEQQRADETLSHLWQARLRPGDECARVKFRERCFERVGAALHDGAIGSLDDRCDLYLPRLRGWAYGGVTVRNVMRMCSGVAWNEQVGPLPWKDERSDVARLGRALESRRPGSILDLLYTLPRAQPQGVAFNYSTADSCLRGALAIWGPAGMEADALWHMSVGRTCRPNVRFREGTNIA